MSSLIVTTRTPPTHWLVTHGDSITRGYGTTAYGSGFNGADDKCYGKLVAVAANVADPAKVFGFCNYGINGQGLNYVYSPEFGTLTADAVTRVDPILAKSGDKKLVVFMGTNDIHLNGTSGAACWTLLQTYINARISAGWAASKICIVTMLPRQSSHEADRTAYNNAIRSNQGSMGYLIADAGADPTIGDAGDETNPTYYLDNIHPINAGHAIIQGLVSAQLYP